MRYYDLKRNWRHVKPHLDNPDVVAALVEGFNKFTFGRWDKPFLADMKPHDFESSDWYMSHRGRKPAYWQYTKHSACHWLVNFELELAQHVVPKTSWRIITSDQHSTVWDGKLLLFDFNYQAMGVSPDDCFLSAFMDELEQGEHLKIGYAEHYTVDQQRNKKVAQ